MKGTEAGASRKYFHPQTRSHLEKDVHETDEKKVLIFQTS